MPSLINLLKDVDVQAISLVPGGANGQRIFLFKCDGFECSTAQSMPDGRIVKAAPGDDWSAFYIVVAEPGAEEKPGVYGDQTTRDVWANEDEIRKAAHRFMRNGGLINKLHQDLEPYGQLVENAIAHQDFTVEGETIRKGSWYIAVEPTEEGRRLVNNGELGGVSIQGLGVRAPMEKDAALVPNKPGVTNWVERAGGLPKFIADIAGDLITERGKSTSNAIQMAWGIVRNWCHGSGNVSAATRAKACAANAEMEAKQASAHISKEDLDLTVPDDVWSWANSEMIEKMESAEEHTSILARVCKTLGIDPVSVDDDQFEVDPDLNTIEEYAARIEKAPLSTATRKKLPKSAFVFPSKAPGSGSYPIHDKKRATNALARAKGKPEESTVRSAVCKRHPDLPSCKKGSLQKGGTVDAMEGELADRVEQIEKTQKEQGEKIDALTAEDSPIMKGIQDLRLKFEEKPSKSDDESGDGDGEKAGKSGDGKSETVEKTGPITESESKELLEKLNDVAEAQGTIAEALVKVNARVETALEGQSQQTDPPEGQSRVEKNGSHPLTGLLS